MKTWEDWHATHQPYELDYHKNEGVKWCANGKRFREFWSKIFEFTGTPEGNILDIGCGVRPPMHNLGDLTVIEPLADKYQKFAPKQWWEKIKVYSQPADYFIPELEGKFDFILCWNCLDHTIEWQNILANIAKYAHRDTTIAIATDFKEPSIGHPGFERDRFFAEIVEHFKILKQRNVFQERDVALILETI